jgi:hypothetical protein
MTVRCLLFVQSLLGPARVRVLLRDNLRHSFQFAQYYHVQLQVNTCYYHHTRRTCSECPTPPTRMGLRRLHVPSPRTLVRVQPHCWEDAQCPLPALSSVCLGHHAPFLFAWPSLRHFCVVGNRRKPASLVRRLRTASIVLQQHVFGGSASLCIDTAMQWSTQLASRIQVVDAPEQVWTCACTCSQCVHVCLRARRQALDPPTTILSVPFLLVFCEFTQRASQLRLLW